MSEIRCTGKNTAINHQCPTASALPPVPYHQDTQFQTVQNCIVPCCYQTWPTEIKKKGSTEIQASRIETLFHDCDDIMMMSSDIAMNHVE